MDCIGNPVGLIVLSLAELIVSLSVRLINLRNQFSSWNLENKSAFAVLGYKDSLITPFEDILGQSQLEIHVMVHLQSEALETSVNPHLLNVTNSETDLQTRFAR